MKKYNKIVVGSLLSALILSTPAIGFADNDNENKGQENKIRTELMLKSKIESNLNIKDGLRDLEEKKDNEEREDNEKKENKGEREDKKEKIEKSWFESSWFKSNNKEVVSAPVISDVTVVSTKAKKATIKWTTDTRSNSYVWISTTPTVDTTVAPNIRRGHRVSKHKIVLNKLTPNTTYYIVVGDSNRSGITKSAEISFTTPATKTNYNPIITSVVGADTIVVGGTENIVINANDPQNKVLNYSINWGDNSAVIGGVFTQGLSLNHVYATAGTYKAKVTITNIDGKKAVYEKTIVVTPIVVVDTTAPIMSNITKTISGTDVVITWKTDEPATSNILYSSVSPFDAVALSTISITKPELVTDHSITIPGLTSSTLYHFILKSADVLNNTVSSIASVFTTN